jgi:hypothetical protein
MLRDRATEFEVGPVLLAGRVTDAIVAAIRKQNAGVRITVRGSYVRVAVARRCEVDARAIEELLGERFRFPSDLERVMPSFRGKLSLSEEQASWEHGPAGTATGKGAY